MTIKLIKIIAPIYQGDVKIGSNMHLHKDIKKGAKNYDDLVAPKALLAYLATPPISSAHEVMISQGRAKDVQKALEGYGYLYFKKQSSQELGIMDPTHRNETLKVTTFAYDPYKSSIEDFVDGLNWLKKYIDLKKGLVFEKETKIYYVDESSLPRPLNRELTVKDFEPKGDK